MNIILDELDNKDNTIIINLISDLKIRKKRNRLRYKNGGHFVSEDTMDNVYKDDIFKYEKIDSNKGFINLSEKKYPVYIINNNKMLSEIELKKFLIDNIIEFIKYYKKFKEGNYNEYEENSKGNMAK